jgi:hypothetical protein
MTRSVRPARPRAVLDESLEAEIKVKRPPKRWQRPSFWVLVAAGLGATVCLVRLVTVSWPVLEHKARPPADGHRAMRGLFHLQVSDGAGDRGQPGVEEAFHLGFQWVVAADPDPRRACNLVNQAPFPLVAAALREGAEGGFLLFGGEEPLPLVSGRSLADIRGAGGVVVLAARTSAALSWRDLQAQSFDGIELFDLSHPPPADSSWDAAWTELARLVRLPYRHLRAARRPVENLARLDDLNRRRRTLLFCGAGNAAGDASTWPSLAMYLLVPDSQGPWYPREIVAALRSGRSFCAAPFLGDASGFRFFAARQDGALVGMMGDTLALEPGLSLVADMNLSAPAPAIELRLFLDGIEISRASGGRLDFRPKKPGAYRVEAYVPVPRIPFGRQEAVFILSNPIFVMPAPAPASTIAPPPRKEHR